MTTQLNRVLAEQDLIEDELLEMIFSDSIKCIRIASIELEFLMTSKKLFTSLRSLVLLLNREFKDGKEPTQSIERHKSRITSDKILKLAKSLINIYLPLSLRLWT